MMVKRARSRSQLRNWRREHCRLNGEDGGVLGEEDGRRVALPSMAALPPPIGREDPTDDVLLPPPPSLLLVVMVLLYCPYLWHYIR